MDQSIINELKTRLEAKREELERELAEIAQKKPAGQAGAAADGYETRYPQFESKAAGQVDEETEEDEAEEYTNRLAVEYALEKDLTEIKAALERIARGTYGACTQCAAPIGVERLRAYPEAVTCGNH
jgi:RNA polymerase-binding transcription factor DksA